MPAINLEDTRKIKSLLDDNKLILIDFYTDWCPPCKKLMPIFNDIASDERFYSVVFLKVNVDVCPSIAGDYKVTSIPSLVFLSKKEELNKKINGFINKESLIEELNGWISKCNH